METSKFNKPSEIICFVISLLFMFGFRFIPPVAPITEAGMAILGVFIGMIFGWCTLSDTLPTSLIAIIAYGISLPAGIYGGLAALFSAYVPLLLVVSFFTIGALMGSGVSEYLVYKICTAKFAQGKPWVLMIVLFYGTWIVGTLTNIMIVTLFMFSILGTLFTQAGFQKGDKTPVMMVLILSCAYLLSMIVYPWGAPQIMVIQALNGIGYEISYASYMITVILTAFVVMAVGLVLMKVTGCDVSKFVEADFSFLAERYEKGLNSHQKGVLFFVLAMCFGCMAISFFPSSLGLYTFVSQTFSIFGWMLLIAGLMLFIKIDGKRLLSPKDMASYFSWDILFIISLGVTVGTGLTAEGTGIGTLLSATLGPVLGGASGIMVALIVAAISLVLTNFLNNNVVIITVCMTIIALAGQGILGDPIVPCIIAILAGNLGFYTPSASFVGALNHTQSHTTPGSIYKYGLIVFVAMFIICATVVPLIVNLLF
jgi:sodium-dependent dicarboxylate transporter 2/3/5